MTEEKSPKFVTKKLLQPIVEKTEELGKLLFDTSIDYGNITKSLGRNITTMEALSFYGDLTMRAIKILIEMKESNTHMVLKKLIKKTKKKGSKKN